MADTLPALHTALLQIWKKNLSQTRERLALLKQVTDVVRTDGTIPSELRAEAHATAHKLAGSLGMFGHADATEHARAVEHLLQPQGSADPEALQAHVEALHAALQDALQD